MEVYKFGGASIKDATAARNLLNVLANNQVKKMVIVLSAMGKTTNALEEIISVYLSTGKATELLSKLRDFHTQIAGELIPNPHHPIHTTLNFLFIDLEDALEEGKDWEYDKFYDAVVPFGEIFSTTIISHFLTLNGFQTQWIDARKWLITNNNHRLAKVDWEETSENCDMFIRPFLDQRIIITQGFVGGTIEGIPTTLGREGSDFTAGILGNCLNASKVTIWKDVPGVLNADPKVFEKTEKFDQLSYAEAIEMAYYGASIIHPKTLHPLQEKNIPLFVRPFSHPNEAGTQIFGNERTARKIPIKIIKDQQILLTLRAKDGSFISESGIGKVFTLFGEFGVKLNMIQLSALSFSICFNETVPHVKEIIQKLSDDFRVLYNSNLQLITVRNFNDEVL
ncbi:MAG: aspartate kinase, partial [Sphingobacteriales bacterium]